MGGEDKVFWEGGYGILRGEAKYDIFFGGRGMTMALQVLIFFYFGGKGTVFGYGEGGCVFGGRERTCDIRGRRGKEIRCWGGRNN